MKLIPTRLSPQAKALVVVAIIAMSLSCHKKGELGTEGAAVAHLEPPEANATTDAKAAKENTAVASEPTVASARRPRERPRRNPSQAAVTDEADEVEEMGPTDIAVDPSALVARASELLNDGRRADSPRVVYYAYKSPGLVADSQSGSSTIYFRRAASTAQTAVDLLKRQTVPTEPAAKQKYAATLIAALSVRARALGLLATRDHSEGDNAETAYHDYLAVESNAAKKTSAEYELASLLYKLEQLEKAKTAYEQLLARNGDDPRALSALAEIHEKLAAAEKSTGDLAKAETDLASAKQYSDRLRDVNSRTTTDDRAEASATDVTGNNADERVNVKERVNNNQRVNVDKRVNVENQRAVKKIRPDN